VDENYTGLLFSAGTNLVLGQYDRVVSDVQTVADYVLSGPDFEPEGHMIEMGDMLAMQGIAYCNLDQPEDAATAYTEALRFSPDFALLYVLRGQARQDLDDAVAAGDDFAAAGETTLGPEFAAWVEAGIDGEWSCKTLQTYTPPE